jgi:hypothetical protein
MPTKREPVPPVRYVTLSLSKGANHPGGRLPRPKPRFIIKNRASRARSSRALVLGVLIWGSSASAAPSPSDRSALEASFEYRAAPNAFALRLSSYQLDYDVDPRAIRLSLRSLEQAADAVARVVIDSVSSRLSDPPVGVEAQGAPGTRYVNFHVRTDGLRSGMYAVSVSFANVVGRDREGHPLRVASTSPPAVGLWVPVAAQPPAEHVGAEYDVDGRSGQLVDPLLARVVAIRVAIAGERRYVLRPERAHRDPDEDLTLTATEFAAPNLHPALEDAAVKHARSTFEGRAVWGFGRFQIACGATTYEVPRFRPLRVVRVVRVRGAPGELALGDQVANGGFHFSTAAPLLVLFEGPDVVFSATESTTRCEFWRFFADEWQLDLNYSLASPHRAHPEWDAATLADLAAARVRPGMTHAMVAWARGFPNEYGTRNALLKAPVWNYAAGGPFGSRVFFRGDRVVKYEPPGRLP